MSANTRIKPLKDIATINEIVEKTRLHLDHARQLHDGTERLWKHQVVRQLESAFGKEKIKPLTSKAKFN